MSDIRYACTQVEKRAEVDSYEDGCDPTTSKCIIWESVNFSSPTLEGLFRRLGEHYYIDIDDLWLADDDDDGTISRVGFNQMETRDGYKASEQELAEWKEGKLTLYLCDYDFLIEKRTVEPIRQEEFSLAGLKTHS